MELMYLWGIPALILIWGVVIYNRFISLRRHMDEAWSGIAVQLKRRHDLLPNLVESVKGYVKHEQGLLEELTRLRGASMAALQGAAPSAGLASSEGALGSALGRLFAVAEGYPALRASENFLSLQQSLQEIEDQLQMARRYYNGTVRSYTILLESFPSLIVAKLLSFGPAAFFELEDPAEAALPEVKF